MNRNFKILIIILLILLIPGAYFGYKYFQEEPRPEPQGVSDKGISLTFISPNGGEEVRGEEENTIEWHISSDAKRPALITTELLDKSGNPLGYIDYIKLTTEIGEADASYPWRASYLITGSNELIPIETGEYFIKISFEARIDEENEDLYLFDVSDDYFTVIGRESKTFESEFKLDDIVKGDKVSGMEVKSVKVFKADLLPVDRNLEEPMPNASVAFSGRTTVRGKFFFEPYDETEMICLELDESSKNKIPQIVDSGECNSDSFCFSNQSFAKEQIMYRSNPYITVTIDNLALRCHPESSMFHMADLIEVN
jgi:hypothetical protein